MANRESRTKNYPEYGYKRQTPRLVPVFFGPTVNFFMTFVLTEIYNFNVEQQLLSRLLLTYCIL